MANWLWFTKLHTKVFRLTGGRIGSNLAGIDIVFVDTVGRKTGQIRTLPIACYAYEDDIIISASNNGQDTDPVWWLNLQAQPEVEIQRGTKRYRVRAEEITGNERAAAWQVVIKKNPVQAHHQQKTQRLIPLVRLRKNISEQAQNQA